MLIPIYRIGRMTKVLLIAGALSLNSNSMFAQTQKNITVKFKNTVSIR